MEHTDVCYAPVLTMSEAYEHPHNKARGTFVEVGGAMQPAPAPRYSATGTAKPRPAPMPGRPDRRSACFARAGCGRDRRIAGGWDGGIAAAVYHSVKGVGLAKLSVVVAKPQQFFALNSTACWQ